MEKKTILLFMFLINSFLFGVDYDILKSENFNIFYPKKYEMQAKKSLAILEYYKDKIVKYTGNTNNMPKLNIVIEDIGMTPNGFSDVNDNTIHIFTYNPSDFGDENWLETVLVHEYIHHLHLNNIGGLPWVLNKIFGNYIIINNMVAIPTRPNLLKPLWLLEGTTVYGESNKISKFSGRLNKGDFSAYMSKVIEGGKVDIVEATYLYNYPYDTPYIYGSAFINYIAEKYGEGKLAEFYTEIGKEPLWFLSPVFPFLSLDLSAKKVFGKTTEELWDDFNYEIMKENRTYKKDPVIYSLDNSLIDNINILNNELYITQTRVEKTGINDVFVFYEIIKKEKNENKVLVKENSRIIKTVVNENEIYYAVEDTKPGYENVIENGYGSYVILKKKDLINNKAYEIIKGDIRDFCLNENKEVVFAENFNTDFGCEIKKINNAGEVISIAKIPIIVSKIEFYKNTLYINGKKEFSLQSIYKLNNNNQIEKVIDTPYEESNMRICKDGILYTANYDKNVNCYKLSFENGAIYKLTDGKFYRDGVINEKTGELFYITYGIKGDEVKKTNIIYQEINLPNVEYSRERPDNYNNINIEKGNICDYSVTLLPSSRNLIVDLDKSVFGINLNGGDAILENNYDLTLVCDKKNKKVGYLAVYEKKFGNTSLFLGNGNIKGVVPDENYTFIQALNYLYKSENSNVKNVILKNKFTFKDDFKSREWEPGVLVNGKIDILKYNLSLDLPIENKIINSSNDRVGVYFTFNNYIFDTIGTLKIRGKYVYDENKNVSYSKDINDEVFGKIRGYYNDKGIIPFNSKHWIKLSAEQGVLISDKSYGLWNPNFLLENIEGAIFIDFINNNSGKDFWYSTGLELKTNLNLLLYVKIPFGIRYSINKEGELINMIFLGEEF